MAYDVTDTEVDPLEAERQKALLTLKPGTLNPAAAPVVPMQAPQVPGLMETLKPGSLGPSQAPVDVSVQPRMPGLAAAQLDPNDPRYAALKPTGARRAWDIVGEILGSKANGPLGALGGMANRDLQAPQLAYQRDLETQKNQLGQEKDIQQMQDTAAQAQQRAALAQKALNPPAAKPEDLQHMHADAVDDAIGRGVDPATDQHVLQIEDAIQRIQKEPAPKTESEYDQKITNYLAANKMADTPTNRDAADKALATRNRVPKDTSAQQNTRLDRSYQFNSGQLAKERTPVEATMSKINGALSNLDLKSPQADALLAPQILSLAAGGQGSGLRMNEAEINRIVGGATKWTQLQSAINKWSTDPAHPQLTPEQRQQMRDIVTAAQQKGTLKQGIIEWGEGALNDAEDVKGHRTTVQQVHKLLDAVDQGKRIQRNKTTGEYRVAPD